VSTAMAVLIRRELLVRREVSTRREGDDGHKDLAHAISDQLSNYWSGHRAQSNASTRRRDQMSVAIKYKFEPLFHGSP
jgi:hypothetical protein